MRRISVIVLGALMCLGVSAGAALAQDTLEVKVPFSFLVNGRTMPAGNYTISRDGMTSSVWLIRGDKEGAFVATVPTRGHDPAGNRPALTFVRHENEYKLSAIWESADRGMDLMN